jgi:hypothetical protein
LHFSPIAIIVPGAIVCAIGAGAMEFAPWLVLRVLGGALGAVAFAASLFVGWSFYAEPRVILWRGARRLRRAQASLRRARHAAM